MATKEEYLQKLDDLQAGKIDKLAISKEEFMDFQPVLMQYPQKKSVIGHAQRGGGAVFYFVDQSQNS